MPPKVIFGLLGVKNHTEPDLSMYQPHTSVIGAYSSLKGQASQFVIRVRIFFTCAKIFKMKQSRCHSDAGVVYQFEILANNFSVSLELVEEGLVENSPGFDKLNLTTFQTDTLLLLYR